MESSHHHGTPKGARPDLYLLEINFEYKTKNYLQWLAPSPLEKEKGKENVIRNESISQYVLINGASLTPACSWTQYGAC